MLERFAPTDWPPELDDSLRQGAELTRLPQCIWVLSRGRIPVNRCCLLSSRIGHNLRSETEWFDALESLGQHLRQRDVTLITAKKTTVHPFAAAFAARHGLSWIELKFSDKPAAGRSLLTSADRDCLLAFRISDAPYQPFAPIERTQILASLATELCVVSATAGSRTTGIVENCLGNDRPTMCTFSSAVETAMHGQWQSKGGILLPLLVRKRWTCGPTVAGEPASICAFPPDDGHWLFHWTRQQQRWPDQTQRQFVDQLLAATAFTGSSPLFALHRILSQRKLVASPQAIRGQVKVVCLSAAPLEKLRQGRIYRKHRVRWDYEPYGLLFRRKPLARFAAQPVWYGTSSEWESASPHERPFFQAKSPLLDWSEEQEWRHVGDLDLGRFAPEEIIVFVPSLAEARFLSSVSRWPVAVVPQVKR